MVGYCYVCKIGIKAKDYLSIHRLPKDKLVREKWFQFIGHKASTNSGICSGHFKQSDFIYKIYGGAVRRYLKPGAYPSIECDSQNTKQDAKINSNSENSNDWILQEDNGIYESKSDTENLIDIPLEGFKQATVLDDPLATTNFDANLETNIPLGDETQECINIDKTKINTESLRHADIQLKRKADDSLTIRKRFDNLKHIESLCREDFTSDESWYLFMNFLTQTRPKLKSVDEKIIRLCKQIKILLRMAYHFKGINIQT